MSVTDLLNEAPTSKFHRRAVVVSGVGFFTDAYDLFVISTVATLVTAQWSLSTTETSWVTGSAILAAFIGAFVFGRIADVLGRKRVYVLVAGIMVVGAVASAFAQGFVWLVVARFILGLGIGGDYPVSAVMMSEYSNRKDRGRLVGLVFSMQALGLVVGPLVGLLLLASGIGHEMTWRLMLGFGAIPAGAAIYLRSKMPESPRYQAKARARGTVGQAPYDAALPAQGAAPAPVASGPALAIPALSEPASVASEPAANGAGSAGGAGAQRLGLREFLTNPRMLLLLLGTAGSWFLFDYAYYGNTLSLPAILKSVDPTATLVAKLAWTLAIFVVFAVPGYIAAVWWMDRIGHRRLQWIGFSVMAVCFVALGAVPQLTNLVVPFIAVFGLSYFFVQFGPNTTTFVLPSEVFPTSMRTTGHGIAAGVGKLGAFVGVFLVPQLQNHIGLRGMLLVAGGAAALGFGLTFVLPEPARRTLEDLAGESDDRHVEPPSESLDVAGAVDTDRLAPAAGVA